MKMPTIMFILVFIFFGVMSSNTDNAKTDLLSDSGYEANLLSAKTTTGKNNSTADPISNSATILLVATGLIGLVGVTRR